MVTRPVATVSQAGEVRSARIESLRALAALGVLEGHAWGYGRGWTSPSLLDTLPHRILYGLGSGVLVFFSLSGYLLFWPFVRRWFDDGPGVELGRYALNRGLRILPLYFVAVVVLLILQEHGGHPTQWFRFLTLTESFSPSSVATVDGPLWSVIVELHFYALLPVIAWLLARSARRRAGVAIALLLAAGVASFELRRWGLAHSGGDTDVFRYSLPGTFVFFLPGMLLALVRLEIERGALRIPRPLSQPLVWIAAAVPFWIWQFDTLRDLPAIAGSLLLVGAVVLPLSSDFAVRALDWRPLAALGIASYSIYVWHMPIEHALANATHWTYVPLLAASLVASCAVAVVSYRVIEKPFLGLRRRWSGDRISTESTVPAQSRLI